VNTQTTKKVLFITWDAPHVNYLEGLFVPIFERLVRDHHFEFHVLQFSWLDSDKIQHLTAVCKRKNIHYTHVSVNLKPVPFLGKYFTLIKGGSILKKYIRDFSIEILMPRSTMPSRIVVSIVKSFPKIKIIFDADGLPIEERVDFAGLKKNSFRYNALKQIERKMLRRADRVIVRSRKAIHILCDQHKLTDVFKFDVVQNGRDINVFKRANEQETAGLRELLSVPAHALVVVYCGSLGPQYGINEMAYIHQMLLAQHQHVYLLLLATNPEFIQQSTISTLPNVLVRKVAFDEVPKFLSIGDVALAIRKPTFSMQGVAPIKLGEYLLIGLPTIASAGIGDTEDILSSKPFVHILKDHSRESLNVAIDWIKLSWNKPLKQQTRFAGEEYFSLETSVQSYVTVLEKLMI
jgi:hypothetical protein